MKKILRNKDGQFCSAKEWFQENSKTYYNYGYCEDQKFFDIGTLQNPNMNFFKNYNKFLDMIETAKILAVEIKNIGPESYPYIKIDKSDASILFCSTSVEKEPGVRGLVSLLYELEEKKHRLEKYIAMAHIYEIDIAD